MRGYTRGMGCRMRGPLGAARRLARCLVRRAGERLRQAAAGGLLGGVLSVALAMVVGLAVLRAMAPAGGAPATRVAAASSLARAERRAMGPITVPARRPAPHQAPPVRVFADLESAQNALGIPVWAPGALPPDLTLLRVEWWPDDLLSAQPASPPSGVLRAWLGGAAGDAVALLEQGRGVGVATIGFPAGEGGDALLGNGTRIAWVRGHPVLPAGVRYGMGDPGWDCPCRWEGDELRLGTDTIGVLGWRLVSDALALGELLQIAAGVQ